MQFFTLELALPCYVTGRDPLPPLLLAMREMVQHNLCVLAMSLLATEKLTLSWLEAGHYDISYSSNSKQYQEMCVGHAVHMQKKMYSHCLKDREGNTPEGQPKPNTLQIGYTSPEACPNE